MVAVLLVLLADRLGAWQPARIEKPVTGLCGLAGGLGIGYAYRSSREREQS